MTQILMVVLAAALGFVLVSLVGTLVSRNRVAVEARMDQLNGRAAQPQAAKKRAARPKKTGPSKMSKELEKLEAELYDAGINIPVHQFFLGWGAATVLAPCVLFALGVGWQICGVIAFAIAFVPPVYLMMRRSKRRKLLEAQLVEAIGLLRNALKAGHSFQAAMQNIAREMESPISDEFGRVFRETQHGMSLEESLERMSQRVGSDDLDMLCMAISIQRQVGGNLAELLDNISGTVQARLDVKAEIKTRTSSGRISGYIIGGLPIVLLVMMLFINPSYGEVFLYTDFGHGILVAAAILEVIGFVIISKIVSVKY